MPENVILDMPFDESENSPIAYDHSPGAHHATITDGKFIPGKFGNCVFFPGVGLAEIYPQFVDLTQDFTYMIWIVAYGYGYQPFTTFCGIKFPGENNEVKVYFNSDFSTWTHVTITKEGNYINVYMDGGLVKRVVQPGLDLTGFCILNTLPHTTGGYSSFDSGKIIQGVAIPPDEIHEEIIKNIKPVEFSVNNVLFTDFGVYVDGMSGPFGRPPKKDGLTVDWPDEHGEVKANSAVDIYEAKQIRLSCWLQANSLDEMFTRWFSFLDAISGPGTFRLQLKAGTRMVCAEVRLEEEVEMDKDKFVEGENFARFTLNLIEPQPVKKILKVTGNSANVSFTTSNMMTIYWGDGSVTANARTGSYPHDYTEPGDKYIVIVGRLDKLSNFTTDAIPHWNYLV